MKLLESKFRQVDHSINGTSHRMTLEGVTDDMIEEIFGWCPDTDRKYSESITLVRNGEYAKPGRGFIGESGRGIYTIYALYGVWRIGGFSHNKHTQELYDFIMDFAKQEIIDVECEIIEQKSLPRPSAQKSEADEVKLPKEGTKSAKIYDLLKAGKTSKEIQVEIGVRAPQVHYVNKKYFR